MSHDMGNFSGGGQVFTDSIHLLTTHEPGNRLHMIPEIGIPGGSVDFFLVSAKNDKAVDFVGIEFQALDWLCLVTSSGVPPLKRRRCNSEREEGVGRHWKMTAKTILVQLRHKIKTFEAVNRKLVLVLQDRLMDYMTEEFSFGHLQSATVSDSIHFHPHGLKEVSDEYELALGNRKSTDAAGVGKALELGQSSNVDFEDILTKLGGKMSPATRWNPATR